jgi:voltage-gated potassium channel
MKELDRKYRQIRNDLVRAAIVFAITFFIGTAWYTLVEGWRLVDAIYMTTITLTTVGFGETSYLSDRGRVFTIGLIFAGVINIGYIVNRFTEASIEGYFFEKRRLRRQRRIMEGLHDHYIICGYGRIGKQIANEFFAEGIEFVVVDSNDEQIDSLRDSGYNGFQADATLDETLLKLGIERAACLVAALPSDAENLYIILSAKTLNPRVRAIARASNEEAVQKLQRAGADVVISPYTSGAKRMAAAALRPHVMDFVDGMLTSGDRPFYMEEVSIVAGECPYVGISLRDSHLRSQSGALILAVRRQNSDEPIVGPTGETVLLDGDRLIAMGTDEQLRALNRILDPRGGRF